MIAAMRDSDVLKTIVRGKAGEYSLPLELIATDRVLKRWAAGSGSGLPSEEWDDEPRAKPTPLPDDVAVDVDLCILKSPPRTRRLVNLWYRKPDPAESIARELDMSRANVYKAHRLALNYLRWRFEGWGNAELARLVQAVDP